MTPHARRLLWALALLGLAASATSLYVHHQLVAHPGAQSFCDINATFSCTEAYLSPYGSVAGIPVSLPGVLWFLGVLVLAFIERRGPAPLAEAVPTYLLLMSALGLVVILYLGYAAFFVLRAVCLMCLATYAAVIGLFVVSCLSTRVPMTDLPRRWAADLRAIAARPSLLAVVLVFGTVAVGALLLFPVDAFQAGSAGTSVQEASQEERAEFERWWTAQPRQTVPVSAEGASVLIVRFTDLQCQFCGRGYLSDKPIIAKYQAAYPGAVRYVSKDYPLSPDCNPNVPRMVHPAACDAAVAVRLAGVRGKRDTLEEYFYSHPEMMSPAFVRQAAASLGGVADFDAQYPRVIEQVKSDISLGRLLNIGQTPTYFINGVRIESALHPKFLDMAIAFELRKAGKLK